MNVWRTEDSSTAHHRFAKDRQLRADPFRAIRKRDRLFKPFPVRKRCVSGIVEWSACNGGRSSLDGIFHISGKFIGGAIWIHRSETMEDRTVKLMRQVEQHTAS